MTGTLQLQRFFERPFIQRNGRVLFILLVLFPVTVIYGWFVYAPSDDMYIFLVYARNFLEGNGFTFNGTVVEGFTSVAWTALIALLGLTRLPLPQLAEGLSMASGLLALFATWRLAQSMGVRPEWLALLPPTLLALTGDFAFYSVVGLEEVLFTALVTWCMALVYSRPADELLKSNTYPLINALVILTRPEGALICALLFLILLRRDTLLKVMLCGLKLVLFLLPVLVAKYAYYGYWLPNTWYVKGNAGFANLEHGAVYFLFNIRRYLGVFVLLLGLTVYGRYLRRPLTGKTLAPVLFILLIWFIYLTVQGGDNMVGGRFFLPVLPMLYCALIKFAQEVRLPPRVTLASATLLVPLLVYGYVGDHGLYNQAQSWREVFEVRKNAGLYLREHFPADTVVALNQAGIIPYYSELRTIDMLGLNDVYIAHYGKRDYSLWYAHQAGDGAYVLAQQPDVIIFGGRGLNIEPGDFISDRELWAADQFHAEYDLTELPGIGFVYIRKHGQ